MLMKNSIFLPHKQLLCFQTIQCPMKVPAVWLSPFINVIFRRPFFFGVRHGVSLPKITWLSEGLVSFVHVGEKGQIFLETLPTLLSPDVLFHTRYFSLFEPCECENPRGRIWKAQMLCLKYQSVNIINDLLLMPLHIQLKLCYPNLQKGINSMLF